MGFGVLVLVLLVLTLIAVVANLYLHLSPRRADAAESAAPEGAKPDNCLTVARPRARSKLRSTRRSARRSRHETHPPHLKSIACIEVPQ